MKKLALSLGLGCIPLMALAGSTHDLIDYFSGVYIGGALGTSILDVTNKLEFDPQKIANISRYDYRAHDDSYNFLGQLYVGYGHSFNMLYLAIEGIAGFPSATKIIKSPDFYSYSEIKNTFGGRFKLGIVEQSMLIYALAGLERTSIARGINFLSGGVYNRDSMLLQNIVQTNSNVAINQVGIGAEFAFNKNWAAQIEYIYGFSNTWSGAVNHSLITFNNPKGMYISTFNSIGDLTLGIKYRFC